jgi:hypothetical protein
MLVCLRISKAEIPSTNGECFEHLHAGIPIWPASNIIDQKAMWWSPSPRLVRPSQRTIVGCLIIALINEWEYGKTPKVFIFQGADLTCSSAGPSYASSTSFRTRAAAGHRLSTQFCMSTPWNATITHSPPATHTRMVLRVHCRPTPMASTIGTVKAVARAEQVYCTMYLLVMASGRFSGITSVCC